MCIKYFHSVTEPKNKQNQNSRGESYLNPVCCYICLYANKRLRLNFKYFPRKMQTHIL